MATLWGTPSTWGDLPYWNPDGPAVVSLTTTLAEALTASHQMIVRAQVFANATTTTPTATLQLTEGSVRVDSSSAVRRVLDATFVSDDGDTSTLTDLLSVNGREIQVWRGILYPNGREEVVSVGRFRIDTVEDDVAVPGAVKVTAPDHAARVVDDRFVTPRPATAGRPIAEEIVALIQESIPGVLVYYPGGTPAIPTGLVWEEDRWGAVSDLARSIGCVVYADATGAFRVEPEPTLSDPPTWTVSTGARGVVLGGTRRRTREAVYNLVRASSAPADGSTPVYAVAEDNDPSSPTWVGGSFGRVPRYYASPLLVTGGQCLSAARAILARALGARRELAVETIVNPALDAGDRLDVFLADGGLERHLVDSFNLPLTAGESSSIQTRSLGGESG